MMAAYLQQHSITPIVLNKQDMMQPLGLPQKRQEGEAQSSGDEPANPASNPPTSLASAISTPVKENSEAEDLRMYNNVNYWGRPYLDCLHVVDDDA